MTKKLDSFLLFNGHKILIDTGKVCSIKLNFMSKQGKGGVIC